MRQNARKNYEARKNKSWGLATGINQIDNIIGGMGKGTLSVIAGFTSHFKTMFAVNIAYINAYFLNYNIAYLSLETPKEIMYDQLLSRHSFEPKFSRYQFIAHDRILRCELDPDEENYLFDVVEEDFNSASTNSTNRKGEPCKRGVVTFLDASDFETFDDGEICRVLEHLDDKMKADIGYGVDAVIVDYIQLCKFMNVNSTSDTNSIINNYVAFFRKLAQGFRAEDKKRQLIVILLSQINRDSWKRASKHDGCYDLTCLADANEIERSANIVITTYTTTEMKISNGAVAQLLKNRTGQTVEDPILVYVNPKAYLYGDEFPYTQQVNADMNQIFGSTNEKDRKEPEKDRKELEKAFDDIFDI